MAGTIPDDGQRRQALAGIAGLMGDILLFASAVSLRTTPLGSLLSATTIFVGQALVQNTSVGIAATDAAFRAALMFT